MSILPEIFESSIDLPNDKGSGDTLLPLWLIDHPTLSLNMFCATGIGGGVDATCSPGDKGGSDGKGEGTEKGESKESNKTEKILSVSGIVSKLKALGATVGHIEHSVKEWTADKCERAVLKLPLPLRDVIEGIFHVTRVGTKVAFATWTAGQALAEQVSKERGSSPEEARRLRGVLSTIDIATTKPVIIAGEMAHMAAPLLFTVGMVPPATAGYLAYSTAKNPLATVRAVRNLIKDKLAERTKNTQRASEGGHATVRLGLEQITHNVDIDTDNDKQLDTVKRIESALRAHNYSDWYISLLSVALDETQNIDEALSLSDELYKEHPTDNAFCPTGEGGGVDPSCSPNQGGHSSGFASVTGEGNRSVVPKIHDELTSLHSRFPRLALLPKVHLEIASGDKGLDNSRAIGLARPDLLSYGKYEHGNNKIGLVDNIPEQGELTLKGLTVGYSIPICFRHEYGHHVQDHIGKPIDPDTGRRMSWQNLAAPYVGRDKKTVVSGYAKESHKEMYAESFAVYTAEKYKRGTLPKPIQHYFDVTIGKLAPKVDSNTTNQLYNIPQENRSGKSTLTGNTRWQFKDDASKIEAFQEWLRDQFDTELTSLTDEELWQRYIASGFKKGAGQAYDNVKRKVKSSGIGPKGKARKELGVSDVPSSTLDFYSMGREDFLEDSFANPTSIEKVKLLAGRAFDDLEGVTDDMSLKMSRVLADGLTQGKSPIDIARDMADEVDISRDRAFKISQTELIRAHAEGSLTALEDLGVEEVGVAVEWSTAGDNKVCPECAALQGIVLTIDEARGQIPVHPLCRCTWVPANVGEEQTEQGNRQKRTAKAIRSAIGDAEEESGEDMDIEIGMDRPKSILGNSVGNVANVANVTDEYIGASNYPGLNYPPSLLDFSRWAGQYGYNVSNAFCATGEGGGVDPSCGGVDKGAGKGKKPDIQDVYERSHIAILRGIKDENRSRLLEDITKLSKKDAQSLHTRLGLKGSSKDAAELRRNLVNELVRKSSETPIAPQASTSVSKPTKDATDRIDTISPSRDKSRDKHVTDKHVNHLVEGVIVHGGKHNLADIVDVRGHLAEKGITNREHQDAVIHEATKRGLVYGSAYEGRHGITPTQQKAQIRYEGAVGTGLLSIKPGVRPTGNVFCATGEGGGVDPSCSRVISDSKDQASGEHRDNSDTIKGTLIPESQETDREVIKHTLATSKILQEEALGIVGEDHANVAKLVTLEGGMRGVLKPASGELEQLREGIDKGTYYKREAAASAVANILGFGDLVPTTVVRGDASIQHFVSGAKTATEFTGSGKSMFDGPVDSARTGTFDYIIGHSDRHSGNWLIKDDKLVLIDNGLSFPHSYCDKGSNRFKDYIDDKDLEVTHIDKNKWPEIEKVLKEHSIEAPAIEMTKKRFNEVVKFAGDKFYMLPQWDKEEWK